jgi:uncharacterized protein
MLVNPTLLHLLDVQRIDVKIDNLQKQRNAATQKLNDLKKRRDDAGVQLAQLDSQLTDRDKERRGLDSNLALDSAKAKKWEARLNEIRNQREFLALSREVEGQKKQNTEVQERVAALSNEVKDINTRAETLRDEVAELEVDVETEQSVTDAKLKELDGQVTDLQKERGEFLSQVPPAILKRYDQVRQKRGAGLAAVSEGRCMACNMGLRPQLYNVIIRGETVEACPSCSRLLYYRAPETDQPQA